jgi:hypothetical protein
VSSVGSVALSASNAGRIVYRSGSVEGVRQLIWFDRSGKELERVPWSPDGTRIAYQSNRKSTVGSTFDTYVKPVSGEGGADLLAGGEGGQILTGLRTDGLCSIATPAEASGQSAQETIESHFRLSRCLGRTTRSSLPTESGLPINLVKKRASAQKSSYSAFQVPGPNYRSLLRAVCRHVGGATDENCSIWHWTTD